MNKERLTKAEETVAKLIMKGLSYAQTASELNVSVHTVSSHCAAIRSKAGKHSTLAACLHFSTQNHLRDMFLQ